MNTARMHGLGDGIGRRHGLSYVNGRFRTACGRAIGQSTLTTRHRFNVTCERCKAVLDARAAVSAEAIAEPEAKREAEAGADVAR